MLAIPSTMVSISRTDPDALDQWGDPDSNATTTVAANVPAAVVEEGQIRHGISELRNDLVENITVRVPFGTDVLEDDHLLDERTNRVYRVISVSRPQSVVGPASVRLTAKAYGNRG